jgi:hypothetical protein
MFSVMKKVKEFGLWVYNKVILKYWSLRYKTTLMTLARLTLLILAKEIVVPWLYACLVIVNGVWPHELLEKVVTAIAVLCIPSFVEILICLDFNVILSNLVFNQFHRIA